MPFKSKKKPSAGAFRSNPDSYGSRGSHDEDEDFEPRERSPRSNGPRPRSDGPPQAPKPKAKRELVIKGFQALWGDLFSSPVHLDSALSKQSPSLKSILAQITPVILLRPSSQAQALGVGLMPDEPWSLSSAAKARWRTAQLIAERLYESMEGGLVHIEPVDEDFPPRFLEEWERDWGKETMRKLVDVLAREAPLSLRAARSYGPEKLMKSLKEGGKLSVKIQTSEFAPQGVRLSSYSPVLKTEAYAQGGFEIQDEGSQVMALFALWPEKFAPLLQKKPGPVEFQKFVLPQNLESQPWNVVDACAGAGGKSLAIADALKGKGRIYAYDTSAKKLQALKRRASHAGYRNIQSVVVPDLDGERGAQNEKESKQVTEKFAGKADIVLVDAPCSGWGVLRRNPDIKWRQDESTMERMPVIQKRILNHYSRLVAPGGRLVFGVCTFRKSETLDIVEGFLKEHPDFEKREGGFLGPGPSDGFFMQAFHRKLTSA